LISIDFASWHLGGGVSPSGVGVIPTIGRLLFLVFNVVGVGVGVVVVVVLVLVVAVAVVVFVVVVVVRVGNCISPVSSFSSITEKYEHAPSSVWLFLAVPSKSSNGPRTENSPSQLFFSKHLHVESIAGSPGEQHLRMALSQLLMLTLVGFSCELCAAVKAKMRSHIIHTLPSPACS